MKSLRINEGDLVLGAGGFTTVRGEAKVRQDLSIALREPLRIDRFHLGWGTVLEENIGMPVSPVTKALIRGECTRIVKRHMLRQSREMQDDRLQGRSSRYRAGEVIERLDSVDVSQEMDRFHVKITLTLGSGESSVLISTVGAN